MWSPNTRAGEASPNCSAVLYGEDWIKDEDMKNEDKKFLHDSLTIDLEKMWNPKAPADESLQNFSAALYGDDIKVEDLKNEDNEYLDDNFSEELDPADRDASLSSSSSVSPLTRRASSHVCLREPLLRNRDGTRSRSRSPILKSESHDVVFATYDKDGTPLQNEFYTPDSHILYESVESNTDLVVDPLSTMNSRGRSLRGRVRSRGSGRVRSRGQQIRCRGGNPRATRWQPGQPLEEVWTTDDDVPIELRQMVRDVISRRQARVDEMEARRVRISERGEYSESENDDVYEDAIDGRGYSLLEGVDRHFEWSSMESFRGVEETFIPKRTGSVLSYTNPYDAFRSYWSDDILQIIVDETNRYASQIQSASFQSDWYPTNAHELLCLFAFWIMTGIIRMPTINSYFSNISLLKTEIFSRITTLKRYKSLNRALNFVATRNNAASSDRLYRLKPIIDHLNSKFQSNYVLAKDICIDESLTLWKGGLNFKQYIRSKATKMRIKAFELCEISTGYLWSFLIYTEKQSTSNDLGLSQSTNAVLKLIEPLLNKGYRLFMGNWLNSPLLARVLKRNGTDCVGTVRESLADIPKLVTEEGQLVARHSGDVCFLSWFDKKRINMISTCHGSAAGLPNVSSHSSARPEPFKPQSVHDYNRAMGGVNLKDQILEPYLLDRKRSAKWYLKFFKRLLDCSIHNSRILLESSMKAREDNLKFRLELVHYILTHHHSLIPKGRRPESANLRTAQFPHIVDHSHWPVRLPQTEKSLASRRQNRSKCVVCLQEGRKTKMTPYMCEDCRMPLCVENCFKLYHTSVMYSRNS